MESRYSVPTGTDGMSHVDSLGIKISKSIVIKLSAESREMLYHLKHYSPNIVLKTTSTTEIYTFLC